MWGNGLGGLLAALLIADILLDPKVRRRTKCSIVLLGAGIVVLGLLISRFTR